MSIYPPTSPFTLTSIQAFVLRWPVRTPVQTSFGTMSDRPAVFVRVEDRDGAVGWGESWCNFPSCGAEHRARLIETVIAPLLLGRPFASPIEAFALLGERTAVLALQSGEPGPMAQAIAGADLALWDLAARRAGLPLWRLLGGASGEIGVYASGINPDRPADTVSALRAAGHRAFKLKIGFGEARDLANLSAIRAGMQVGETLMADANQAWDLDTALRMVTLLRPFDLAWLEEPLRVDRPHVEWDALAQASGMPLAGGENLIGESAFAAAIEARPLRVVQPDVAKWGGISGVLPVLRRIEAEGLRYCPHFLGGGIGLLHSAHLLAARPAGPGLLEIDSNENPLRSALADPVLGPIVAGRVTLPDTPGIGIEPDIAALQALCAPR